MKEELNLQCPYKVLKDRQNYIYYFTTKNQIEYSVVFSEASSYFVELQSFDERVAKKIFAITLEKISTEKAPLDFDTEKTMNSIIHHFFEDKQNSLLYICDISDNKQDKRKKKFNNWYSRSKFSSVINKTERSILNLYHTGLFFHVDNSYKEKILEIYYEYIDELNDK